MPIAAAAMIDPFHYNANIAAFCMDDHAAAEIKANMRFVVSVRGAVSEQKVTSDQLVSRNGVTQCPESIAILTIVPNARLTHEPGKKTRTIMRHEVGESSFVLALAEGDRARELLIHCSDLRVGKIG